LQNAGAWKRENGKKEGKKPAVRFENALLINTSAQNFAGSKGAHSDASKGEWPSHSDSPGDVVWEDPAICIKGKDKLISRKGRGANTPRTKACSRSDEGTERTRTTDLHTNSPRAARPEKEKKKKKHKTTPNTKKKKKKRKKKKTPTKTQKTLEKDSNLKVKGEISEQKKRGGKGGKYMAPVKDGATTLRDGLAYREVKEDSSIFSLFHSRDKWRNKSGR